MSIAMMSQVWDRFPAGSSSLLAMLMFADYSDDQGGNIFPSMATIARRLRLTESQARRVVHRLIRDGWVQVAGNADGGAPGTTRQYRIDLEKLKQTPSTDARGTASASATPTGSADARGTGSAHARDPLRPCAETPSTDASQSIIDPPITTKKRNTPVKKFTDADSQLAEFMLAKIRELNPGHKEPNLNGWSNAIRLMRERDQRTHDEIRSLFIWANGHQFWKTNILSPDSLRKQWDKLTIQRSQDTPKSTPAQFDDYRPARRAAGGAA